MLPFSPLGSRYSELQSMSLWSFLLLVTDLILGIGVAHLSIWNPPPTLQLLNNFLLVIARHTFVHLQISPDTYDLTVMSKEAQALELGAKDVVR